jgi:serine/threonine protein kinase
VSLKKLGRYDLVRVLGKGAMGIVYEGRDPNLERRVAIKTVKVENLSQEAAAEYEARFRTEARSAARLQHPNIVSVYDSDRDGDIAFLVMEYIQGDDLKHHLDQGHRYSLEQSLRMIRDLLSALDYAHKQGVVHRDIKPANLLIEPGGRVKLTDFGVARMQDSGDATRTQGAMVGTLKYMSPEQVQGQKIDSRADLFSVGVVLYQLLTDKRPFDGDNDFSIIHQIIGHTPPAPSTFNSRLPSAIDAVVARALAKDREQRFATARDFASALQSAIRRAEDATVVPPPDPFKKADAARSGSRGHQSAPGPATTPGSGSTVTQELELVYWKDIKDSTDKEELEGFLIRFPDGIYADLARRRLRKLSGAGSPDQTILSGADLEATRVRTATMPLAVPLSAVPAEASAEPAATISGTPPVPGQPELAPTPTPTQAPVAADAAIEPTAPLAPASRIKPPAAMLAGLAALAAAGIAAFLLVGKGAPAQSAAGPAMAASSPARAVRTGPPVVVAEKPASNPAAANGAGSATAARASAAKSDTPLRTPSAARTKPAGAPEPHPPGPVQAVSAGQSPVEACKDKVFVMRELCLAEHCDKPGSRNHPLCVKRREEARLREDSRVRN